MVFELFEICYNPSNYNVVSVVPIDFASYDLYGHFYNEHIVKPYIFMLIPTRYYVSMYYCTNMWTRHKLVVLTID